MQCTQRSQHTMYNTHSLRCTYCICKAGAPIRGQPATQRVEKGKMFVSCGRKCDRNDFLKRKSIKMDKNLKNFASLRTAPVFTIVFSDNLIRIFSKFFYWSGRVALDERSSNQPSFSCSFVPTQSYKPLKILGPLTESPMGAPEHVYAVHVCDV